MKKYLALVLLFVTSSVFVFATDDVEVISHPELLHYAKMAIPNYGYLRKKDNGFVYLQVSNDFVFKLLPLLNQPEAKEPPYFGKTGVGTHVSVIRTFEIKDPRLLRIADLGKRISFEVTNLGSVKPDNWPECEKLWILQIKCPELEALRTQYGFPPKIAGHEFHITIAFQKSDIMAKNELCTNAH